MSISFQCPQCDKKLKAPDSAAGRSSNCPRCHAVVTCPEPIFEAEVVVTKPRKPRKRAASRRAGARRLGLASWSLVWPASESARC
jgi:phage FluMu protein Com